MTDSPLTSSFPDSSPSPEPPIPEWTSSELSLERARCALELERLALEKDRLETERLRLERNRELYGAATNNLRVGMGVLVFATAVALILGLLFGYSAGVESGRLQAPAPRKIVVNGAFLELLRQTPSGATSFASAPTSTSTASSARTLPWVTLYTRPAYSKDFGNLPLIR